MNIQSLWLIGVRLDPDKEEPQVYTIYILGGNDDKPVVADDQIVFFSNPKLSHIALQLAAPEIQALGPVPEEVSLVCDIAEVLYLVNSENVDQSAIVIDSLNLILDLVKATNISMPVNYKQDLYQFADYLTFDKDFSVFLNQEIVTRKKITDALLWCLGAIVAKSKFLTN